MCTCVFWNLFGPSHRQPMNGGWHTFSSLLCVRDFLLFGLLSFSFLFFGIVLLFVIIIPQPFKFMFIYPRLRSTFMLKHSHIFSLFVLVWYVHAFIYIAKKVTNNDFCYPSPVSYRIASHPRHITYNLYSTANHRK